MPSFTQPTKQPPRTHTHSATPAATARAKMCAQRREKPRNQHAAVRKAPPQLTQREVRNRTATRAKNITNVHPGGAHSGRANQNSNETQHNTTATDGAHVVRESGALIVARTYPKARQRCSTYKG